MWISEIILTSWMLIVVQSDLPSLHLNINGWKDVDMLMQCMRMTPVTHHSNFQQSNRMIMNVIQNKILEKIYMLKITKRDVNWWAVLHALFLSLFLFIWCAMIANAGTKQLPCGNKYISLLDCRIHGAKCIHTRALDHVAVEKVKKPRRNRTGLHYSAKVTWYDLKRVLLVIDSTVCFHTTHIKLDDVVFYICSIWFIWEQSSVFRPKEHLPHEEVAPIHHQGAVTWSYL